MLPLETIKTWAPFKIDALGIVTLLGADSLRHAVARLVSSPFAEYLPLLAAHVIADNSIAEAVPGFVLYNITDGIMATDLSAWWTRWLLSQRLTWNSTTLHIKALPTPQKLAVWYFVNCGISVILDTFLVAFPVLLGDWYGFTCSVALIVTIVARASILSLFRRSLDKQVLDANAMSTDPVKLFITLPNGKAITILTTRGITINCLLTEARPMNPSLYLVFRTITWVAFAVHVVTLGMTCLCLQLILIGMVLIPSILIVQRVGCDEFHIGQYLEIDQHDVEGVESRAKAYSLLNLDEKEEQSMLDWNLFPLKSNTVWWEKYRQLQGDAKSNPLVLDTWQDRLAEALVV